MMAKHTVVTMPGDGIGNQVLPEALRVFKAVGFDARIRSCRYRLGIWCNEGNALPERTHRSADEAQARPVWRHHVEAEQRSPGRAEAGTARQGATSITARS